MIQERTVISEEEAATLKSDELRGFGKKIDGVWYFCAFIDRDENRRIMVAFAHHKKYKIAMRDCMNKALAQVQKV